MTNEQIDQLHSKALQIVEKDFGLTLSRTKIELVEKAQWDAQQELFEGRNALYKFFEYTAIILKENKHLINDYIHEVFGHGLFYENAISGQIIVNNTEEFYIKLDFIIANYPQILPYSFSDFYNVKYENQACKLNRDIYLISEAVAIWIELYILEQMGYSDLISERIDSLKITPVFEDRSESLFDLYQFMNSQYKSLGMKMFLVKLGFLL